MKGVMRFGKKGKLSPRYIGPYCIAKRICNVAYELELPHELAVVHPVFHISMLKKCIGDPSLILPTESIRIKDNLSYEEILVQTLDRQVHRLRTKDVASVKVLWRNQFVEEATWEAEEDMKNRYPYIFESGGNADQVRGRGFERREKEEEKEKKKQGFVKIVVVFVGDTEGVDNLGMALVKNREDAIYTLVLTILAHFNGRFINQYEHVRSLLNGLRCRHLGEFRWYKNTYLSRVMELPKNDIEHWKAKFIDDLPPLFAERVKKNSKESARQLKIDKLRERSQLGDFCTQFGLPDSGKQTKHRDSSGSGSTPDKPYKKKRSRQRSREEQEERRSHCKSNRFTKNRHIVTLPYEDNFSEDDIPTKSHPCQMNAELVEFCKKDIDSLLQKGLIKPSKSPWSCTAFYVNNAAEKERGVPSSTAKKNELDKLKIISDMASSSVHLEDSPLYAELRAYLSQKQGDTFASISKDDVDDIKSYEKDYSTTPHKGGPVDNSVKHIARRISIQDGNKEEMINEYLDDVRRNLLLNITHYEKSDTS
ncbi:hypothetical protein MTR67_023721 [Solanum verrucosum]|uniref:Tf2-1-like SH3-like domain-containing protein n=1 Tax=Solanum verrucosum TaxID=315347 RepID=A0AAF0TS40_SOLVR|nr:hypothetical protein MTR67_023721 [Solanum verrucosum]